MTGHDPRKASGAPRGEWSLTLRGPEPQLLYSPSRQADCGTSSMKIAPALLILATLTHPHAGVPAPPAALGRQLPTAPLLSFMRTRRGAAERSPWHTPQEDGGTGHMPHPTPRAQGATRPRMLSPARRGDKGKCPA